MLAADPERLRARLRIHGEVRHQRRDRRRLGRRRRGRAAHDRFQAAYARRGIQLELGERLALGYQFHVSSNREQAIREAAPHYEENMKMFGELRLVRALTDEPMGPASPDIRSTRRPRSRRRGSVRSRPFWRSQVQLPLPTTFGPACMTRFRPTS